MFVLNSNESKEFTAILGIDLLSFSADRVSLLNSIVSRYQEKIPFQNVSLLATEISQRRMPTWDEIKHSILSQSGGLCYSLNMFLHAYLRSLNFDANLALSTYGTPDSHTVILVRGVVHESDVYMIDGGSGYATFAAIPLDFIGEESPVYNFSYTAMKLRRNPQGASDPIDNRIQRVHISQSTGEEKTILDFSLTPIEDIATQLAHQHRIFTDPTFTPFYHILVVITFSQEHGAKILQGNQFVKENMTTHRLENHGNELKSAEEFAEIAKNEFSKVNSLECLAAFNHKYPTTSEKTNETTD